LSFNCFHLILFEKDKIKKTVNIEASTVEIEERGVKLRLTIVDTPGFGDSIDSSEWYFFLIIRLNFLKCLQLQ